MWRWRRGDRDVSPKNDRGSNTSSGGDVDGGREDVDGCDSDDEDADGDMALAVDDGFTVLVTTQVMVHVAMVA